VLLLGLVLVTSAERLSGAPMLAVLCGGLLIGRLSTEVSQSRWRQLSKEERQSFWSPARWQTSLNQLATSLIALGNLLLSRATALGGWLKQRTATVNASVTAGAATGAASSRAAGGGERLHGGGCPRARSTRRRPGPASSGRNRWGHSGARSGSHRSGEPHTREPCSGSS
jgi:hypothetical protein